MSKNSEVLAARSLLGLASRRRDAEAITDARRDLAAAKIAAYIEKVVAEAPPLTDAQRDRLSAIIGAGLPSTAPPLPDPRREAQARLDAARHAFRTALTDCAVCGIPEQGHPLAHGPNNHPYTPPDPDQVASIAAKHRPNIHEAERALTAALTT